jgi:hypothetical protein
MQRNHLFIKASGLHYYRRTKCRDIGREMNRSARRKMLRVVGIIMVVMLPVMLALWFAQLRAVTETSAQLRTFAELALDKTELVIQQVELAVMTQKNIRANFVRTSSIYVERCSWSPVRRRFNLCRRSEFSLFDRSYA